jgi:hypothetical protein
MKQCRFCGVFVEELTDICVSCGYDFKKDIVDPNFMQKKILMADKKIKKTKAENKSAGISPGVKKFMFTGLAILVFSILYKYNFNLSVVYSEILRIPSEIKSGKFIGKSDNKKDKENKKVELINVLSFMGNKEKAKNKDLKIEGISFDVNGKSFIIINGSLVSEGQSFKNITVKKISKDMVEAIVDGQNKILTVNQIIPLRND